MLVACATNDNINLIDDHFGDADYFDIYEVSKLKYILKESIVNSTTSNQHSDPKKAKQILELLHSNGIHLLVNKAFGANITTVKKFLLPVVIRVNSIDQIMKLIQNSFDFISNTIINKKNCYLVINNNSEVHLIETAQK